MIDNSQLQKLLALSDEELRKKVAEAAIAAGADKYMTATALSDVTKLRAMMSALTSEQVNAMLSKMGADTATELSRRINETK